MGNQIFIPMTDEILFDRPELISSPLRPYNQDIPCLHWLEIEINPTDTVSNLNKASAQPSVAFRPRQRKPILDIAYPQFAAA